MRRDNAFERFCSKTSIWEKFALIRVHFRPKICPNKGWGQKPPAQHVYTLLVRVPPPGGDSDLTLKQYHCVCMVCILCKFKTFNDQNANLIRWNVLETLSWFKHTIIDDGSVASSMVKYM